MTQAAECKATDKQHVHKMRRAETSAKEDMQP